VASGFAPSWRVYPNYGAAARLFVNFRRRPPRTGLSQTFPTSVRAAGKGGMAQGRRMRPLWQPSPLVNRALRFENGRSSQPRWGLGAAEPRVRLDFDFSSVAPANLSRAIGALAG